MLQARGDLIRSWLGPSAEVRGARAGSAYLVQIIDRRGQGLSCRIDDVTAEPFSGPVKTARVVSEIGDGLCEMRWRPNGEGAKALPAAEVGGAPHCFAHHHSATGQQGFIHHQAPGFASPARWVHLHIGGEIPVHQCRLIHKASKVAVDAQACLKRSGLLEELHLQLTTAHKQQAQPLPEGGREVGNSLQQHTWLLLGDHFAEERHQQLPCRDAEAATHGSAAAFSLFRRGFGPCDLVCSSGPPEVEPARSRGAASGPCSSGQ